MFNTIKINFKMVVLIALIAWGYSLFWMWSTTRETCSSIAYKNAYEAYKLGKRESEREIDHSPYVMNSLWSSEYISFDIRDTYFARGNDLRRSLESLVESEGFNTGSSSGPFANIEIDGSESAVKVNISINRMTCFNVTDHLSSNLDKHVKDIVQLFSEQKIFLPKTSFDEVQEWLVLRCKAICVKFKERNTVVIEKLEEHVKNEGKSWFKEDEYRYLL